MNLFTSFEEWVVLTGVVVGVVVMFVALGRSFLEEKHYLDDIELPDVTTKPKNFRMIILSILVMISK